MTESERKATSEKYYQELKKQLNERVRKDKRLNALSKKIMENAADFNDTAQYSELVSNHIAAVLQENIGEISSPLAKEFVCTELLKDQHSAINETLGKVQVSIDEKNGIHINPQKAPFPFERVKQVAHALEDTTVSPETIKRRAGAPVANVSKSFHDSYMKENAKFRNDAGLKCYIVRMGTNCCKWCSEVAGKYKFGEQPDDIFRRHDNCDCTIIYGNQVLRGKQTADGIGRTKTWEQIGDVPTDYQPTVFTQEQAKAIEQRNLQYRGLTLAGRRDIITGRGNGTGYESGIHTFEKIGEVDPHDKKAVDSLLTEFERKYKNSEIEHCRVITLSGEVYEVHGDRYTVNTTLLGDLMHGSTNEHNHVTGESQYSFSWEDLRESAKDGSEIMIAFDEKYWYRISFNDKSIPYDEIYDAYMSAVDEVDEANFNSYMLNKTKCIADEDYQHEVMTRTCGKIGVQYERHSKK